MRVGRILYMKGQHS